MARSLFERMTTWARLFALRPDVEVEQALLIEPGVGEQASDEEGPDYPTDGADFATHASDFSFHYYLKENPAVSHMLFLGLAKDTTDASIEFEGDAKRVAEAVVGAELDLDEPTVYELDYDRTGTGLSGLFVISNKGPSFVLWDIKDSVPFASLTEYLTLGAKHAFSRGPQSWQSGRRGAHRSKGAVAAEAIRQRSLPAETPVPELRAALIAQGGTAAEVDDMLEWLGPDASLLAALPANDVRRHLPHWYSYVPASFDVELDEEKNEQEEYSEESPRMRHVPSGEPVAANTSFAGQELGGSDFSGAVCKGISFAGGRFSGSTFDGGTFDGSDFSKATLRDVTFRKASLRGCSFRGAILQGAVFDSADCTGADFSAAELREASFLDTTLKDVTMEGAAEEAMVRAIFHRGARAKDIDTLVVCAGKIRNESVLEKTFEYLGSLMGGYPLRDSGDAASLIRSHATTLRRYLPTCATRAALETLLAQL